MAASIRSQIHETAARIAASRAKIDEFVSNRVKSVTGLMREVVESGAVAVPIHKVKEWLALLNPQISVDENGAVVAKERFLTNNERKQDATSNTNSKASGNPGSSSSRQEPENNLRRSTTS